MLSRYRIPVTIGILLSLGGCVSVDSNGLKLANSLLTALPSAKPSVVPTPSPSVSAQAVATNSPLKLEAEKSVKTAGKVKYPVVEPRNAKDVVMMFSGGDAGGQAVLETSALKGNYRIFCAFLNHVDSPEMTIQLGGHSLLLPAGSKDNSNGSLRELDLGVHPLAVAAGHKLTMTVGGNVTGKGNAWIGVDYFRFEPQP